MPRTRVIVTSFAGSAAATAAAAARRFRRGPSVRARRDTDRKRGRCRRRRRRHHPPCRVRAKAAVAGDGFLERTNSNVKAGKTITAIIVPVGRRWYATKRDRRKW